MTVPHQNDWVRLLSQAIEEWERRGDKNIPLPPIPFRVRGKGPAVAQQIREQWVAFVVWMMMYGFEQYLEQCPQSTLIDDHGLPYDVAEDLAADPRPDRGYIFEARPVPHQLLVRMAEMFLIENWPKIVGRDFASITRLLKLKGAKKRRLVIAVDPENPPSWGRWDTDASGNKRYRSTVKLVNRALWPMEIYVLTPATARWSD
jgi:hypothetical protein